MHNDFKEEYCICDAMINSPNISSHNFNKSESGQVECYLCYRTSFLSCFFLFEEKLIHS